ncbi:Proline iminopeptidase [Cytospora mali]|uniref:Proline iminopeptidase n=1 Tax=Cytospora mali TaxID=578113 RepID=A0A194V7G3_CYTMA|nr:Proline iminopeptidase [Valsa mali var. pyri (nom. inval.)]
MSPRVLTLPDGRKIEYLTSGAEDGFPMVFIHGTPGAYIVNPTMSTLCDEKKIKLITMSRAGYGSSTRNKGRRVVDVVADIQALLEHLRVEKCVVGGWSGGGPHSLACAARLPGCIASLVIAGQAPYGADGLDFHAGQGKANVEEIGVALKGEEELQKYCEAERPGMLAADVKQLTEALSSLFPEVDREALLRSHAMNQNILDSNREAYKHNSDGRVDDMLSFVQPWGFELNEVEVPVFLYHGSEDKMVPLAHGE